MILLIAEPVDASSTTDSPNNNTNNSRLSTTMIVIIVLVFLILMLLIFTVIIICLCRCGKSSCTPCNVLTIFFRTNTGYCSCHLRSKGCIISM